MLRQITLQVRTENGLQDIAKANGVKLGIVDCKPFNKTGMSLLLELRGESKCVRAAVAEIRRMEGVRQAIEGEGEGDSVPLLVVLSRPAICRASNDAAIVCLECPLNTGAQPASWKFIIRKTSDFRQVLSKLEKEGVEAKIEDVAPVERRATLTDRQKEIMSTAVAQGYFEFPRKISLTGLSEMVGVKPSTLSEILRSAERRIMANAVGVPFQEE
ncbi:MAG: helix-turn-helix domain-containing protein [Nitrososphaerota archaeon]|jgi:predicted DNA binding protein|nr:helix-turn-helix domain-containing protein [Nitrososphaerota archaeon]MDG6942257.1 helix-turn-helix domain-containing protein [Nitrososphaerota archaeon]MDG6942722.1 helix-turn-helix domain-containing protein [Nitrososphaerota archaeon]MDG6948509.1 helix-turn-helix domain-containing protein [Nitrososphaerota archaeon]MDG6950435.1 helix-turn-helix domain-containing protein [Nitrososphaerota archaeon]